MQIVDFFHFRMALALIGVVLAQILCAQMGISDARRRLSFRHVLIKKGVTMANPTMRTMTSVPATTVLRARTAALLVIDFQLEYFETCTDTQEN